CCESLSVCDGIVTLFMFFFSGRRRHTRSKRDWSSDVCSSDLGSKKLAAQPGLADTLGRPRYEVLPLSGAEAQVTEHVPADATVKIGRASCRERMSASVVGVM